MTRAWWMAAAMIVTACSKSEEAPKSAPSTSTSTTASASARADSGTGTGTGEKAASFAGTYSLAPGKLYIPSNKDWGSVKQAKDEPTKLVGDGTLSLTVDGSGRVSGEVESGPSGPAVIDGSVIDGEVRANVRRKDPGDEGLTGTLVGTRSADAISGKLSLAESNAALVREGTFTLKKK